MRIYWTEEEDDTLIILYKKEATFEQVKRIFPHRSVSSLRNKIASMGLRFAGPSPKIDMDEFKRFMKEAKK
jgi:hypothetical protein